MSQKPRTTISRRQALKTVGACSVAPLLSPFSGLSHPLVPLQEGQTAWVPRFFDSHQIETVSTICELIIPATDTPGARAAGVHVYVDFNLSRADRATREAFLNGLSWFDEKGQSLFGRVFVELDQAQQVKVLEIVSAPDNVAPADETGARFFRSIKEQTIEGYYTSEIGLVQELGYHGKSFVWKFPGCQHQEHKNWEPD